MSLCVIAMFKNEGHILNDWISHYFKQGVEKIFLIDNGSTDGYRIADDVRIEIVFDTDRYVQSQCYNKHFLDKCKRYDWVLVCDLDEFVYAHNGHSTINSYLNSLDQQVSQVFVPWKIFGSNGNIYQPEHVFSSFTKRINYDKQDGFHGVRRLEDGTKVGFAKALVRTIYLKQFQIHAHNTSNNYWITSDNRRTADYNGFVRIDETILRESCLNLNHYAIQSFDWFMRVKATRGDNTNPDLNNVRNLNYFQSFDGVSNDVDDLELAIITNN